MSINWVHWFGSQFSSAPVEVSLCNKTHISFDVLIGTQVNGLAIVFYNIKVQYLCETNASCKDISSIHPFSIPLSSCSRLAGGLEFPSCHWVRGRKQPWQVSSPLQGPHMRQTTIHIQSYSLQSPISLTFMFSDCGRKPERPGKTQSDKGRTYKVRTRRFREGTQDSPPCCPDIKHISLNLVSYKQPCHIPFLNLE